MTANFTLFTHAEAVGWPLARLIVAVQLVYIKDRLSASRLFHACERERKVDQEPCVLDDALSAKMLATGQPSKDLCSGRQRRRIAQGLQNVRPNEEDIGPLPDVCKDGPVAEHRCHQVEGGSARSVDSGI
eukprot:scaffold7027_cov67-Phaeocystis_antarctica.AAC.2